MSDRIKIERLFDFLKNTYVLKPSYTYVGEVKMYVDSSDLDRENEDGELIAADIVDRAYFNIALKGVDIHHTAGNIGIFVDYNNLFNMENFSDIDLDEFIKNVKKNFRIFGEKLPAKQKPRPAKAPAKKKKAKKYVVVKGVRYYAK